MGRNIHPDAIIAITDIVSDDLYIADNVISAKEGTIQIAVLNLDDIAAFVLRDGRRITVLDGWNSRDRGLLKRLHSSACGTFGTVLGPNADRFHRDHFHFDVASHRGGAYCR